MDLPSGKNLVGAFYQPKAVIILTDFLKTLPERDYLSGLAEVVKYGLIADDLLFCTLKNNTGALLNRQHSILTKIINTCCGLKAGIVARDEKDHGLRATLNFGHSLGHAIESLQNYRRTRHGEAIAMGMVFASKLSYALRVSPSDHTSTIALLLTQLHLPTQWPSFSHKDYQRALLIDKKTRDRNIRFILLEKIGRVKSVTLDIKSLLPCL
ncbi:MAG: 3-dehydroquinate synthase [uncultured bacterium]|nr:MAG: 3-dehydroquinate synthase [uncultured bacterium]